jgi:hypothetical protein
MKKFTKRNKYRAAAWENTADRGRCGRRWIDSRGRTVTMTGRRKSAAPVEGYGLLVEKGTVECDYG